VGQAPLYHTNGPPITARATRGGQNSPREIDACSAVPWRSPRRAADVSSNWGAVAVSQTPTGQRPNLTTTRSCEPLWDELERRVAYRVSSDWQLRCGTMPGGAM